MKTIKFEDLEFDEDFLSERAEKGEFFQIKLSLPKGFQVTGFTRKNIIKIGKKNSK